MNKKIIKTKEKILEAFKELLAQKKYNNITIQEIIEQANIARSTFYKHYKTKDDLLKEACQNIFDHVFSHTLTEEKSHDFSKSSIFDYTHYITHLFYHIHDEKIFVKSILNSELKFFFMDNFKLGFYDFANTCLTKQFFNNKNLPSQIKILAILNNFSLLIDYWNKTDFKETPEKLTEYFIVLNN